MPEKLPTAEHIGKTKKRLKDASRGMKKITGSFSGNVEKSRILSTPGERMDLSVPLRKDNFFF